MLRLIKCEPWIQRH